MLGACALGALAPRTARAQDDVPVVTRTYALTGARVVQAPGRVLERATVVVRDGLIAAVGPDVRIPFDADVIAADSLTVYAGFIDGLSHAAVEMPDTETPEVDDPGNPPPAAAGIQPERGVRAFLDPASGDLDDLRALGFTAAHVVPEGRMLPGTGAVIQLAGATPDAMVLADQAALFMQYETAPGSWPNLMAPSTPMGIIAKMRQLYREAERRQALEAAYARSPRGRERTPSDATHTALFPVLDGARPIMVYADDALELHRTLALQRELGFSLMLAGLAGSFDAIDRLAEADVPLFLTLDLPEEKKDGGEAEADTSAVTDSTRTVTEEPGSFFMRDYRTRSYADAPGEKENLEARQALVRARYYGTAALLRARDLRFAFSTRNVKPKDVRTNLALMIDHGLPEDAALAALTTDAAALLGLSDRLGTVETGKIANLVVTDGPYFGDDTTVRHVFVDGLRFDYAAEGPEPVTAEGEEGIARALGTWTFTVSTPQGDSGGTITLTGSDDDLRGTITSDQSSEETEIENATFEGDTLSFSFDGGDVGTVEVSVTLDAGTFDGTATVGDFGSFPIEGTRTAFPDLGF